MKGKPPLNPSGGEASETQAPIEPIMISKPPVIAAFIRELFSPSKIIRPLRTKIEPHKKSTIGGASPGLVSMNPIDAAMGKQPAAIVIQPNTDDKEFDE